VRPTRAAFRAPLLAAVVVLAGAASVGCAALRPVFAPSAELDVYRAFRVSAAPGTRLAHAQRYLARFPQGTFAAEVRAAFDEDEPRFFEACQRTRAGVLRYLVDLPAGPHASAAQAMLLTFDVDQNEAELRDVARRSRADEARLESAAAQRRAVGETILGALGAVLDDGLYGEPAGDAPPSVRAVLLGRAPATWGTVPTAHEEDLFFVLPTRPVRESRLLTLEVALRDDDAGRVTAAVIDGADMFVKWAEAERIVALDPFDPGDRTEAYVHVASRLDGALERRFPTGSCPRESPATGQGGQAGQGGPMGQAAVVLVSRACNGWQVVVTAGGRAGDKDTILVTGPRARRAADPR
jgi:hypothetical protein